MNWDQVNPWLFDKHSACFIVTVTTSWDEKDWFSFICHYIFFEMDNCLSSSALHWGWREYQPTMRKGQALDRLPVNWFSIIINLFLKWKHNTQAFKTPLGLKETNHWLYLKIDITTMMLPIDNLARFWSLGLNILAITFLVLSIWIHQLR